jgi:hypothetical protein
LVGSSSNSTSGSCASARTIAARRRSPPEADAASRDYVMGGDDRVGFVADRCVVAAHHIVAQGRKAAQVGLLFKDHDPGARDDRPAALIALDAAAEQLEQGGLARAVAPDQCEAIARTDMDVQVAKKPSRTLDKAEAFECENRCCHVRVT